MQIGQVDPRGMTVGITQYVHAIGVRAHVLRSSSTHPSASSLALSPSATQSSSSDIPSYEGFSPTSRTRTVGTRKNGPRLSLSLTCIGRRTRTHAEFVLSSEASKRAMHRSVSSYSDDTELACQFRTCFREQTRIGGGVADGRIEN